MASLLSCAIGWRGEEKVPKSPICRVCSAPPPAHRRTAQGPRSRCLAPCIDHSQKGSCTVPRRASRSPLYAGVYSSDIRRVWYSVEQVVEIIGTPNGTRTRVSAVKGGGLACYAS